LGWAGMMIGLQADLKLKRYIPNQTYRVVFSDLILTILIVSTLTGLLFLYLLGAGFTWSAVMLAVLLSVMLLGWTGESRSFRIMSRSMKVDKLKLMQASSGLVSLVTILLYGILVKVSASNGTWLSSNELIIRTVSSVLLIATLVVAIALLGKWLMRIIGRREPEFLVLFFGLVSLSVGGAVALGFSPLFVSMLCGAMIANIGGKDLSRFRRFILEAERPIALGLLLVAGMWASPHIGIAGLLLIATLLLAKFLCKIVLPVRLPMLAAGAGFESTKDRIGYFRQSPLALILGVELLFLTHVGVLSQFSLSSVERLIGILIATGVLSHFLSFLIIQMNRGKPN